MSDLKSRKRPGEVTADLPSPDDARLYFIGRIRTPWTNRDDCPRQGSHDGPDCRIELFEPWDQALAGLERYDHAEVLYWLDRARRDLLTQTPREDGTFYGTFGLRSPQRPNPIGTSLVRIVRIEPGALVVRGLDCLDGTPLLDIKPERCGFTPQVRPKP